MSVHNSHPGRCEILDIVMLHVVLSLKHSENSGSDDVMHLNLSHLISQTPPPPQIPDLSHQRSLFYVTLNVLLCYPSTLYEHLTYIYVNYSESCENIAKGSISAASTKRQAGQGPKISVALDTQKTGGIAL